jgi:hypothetical protein
MGTAAPGIQPPKDCQKVGNQVNKKMIKETATTLAAAAAILAFSYALNAGIEKQDRINCTKLQQQAIDYPTFYSTESEKRTCREVGITLNK